MKRTTFRNPSWASKASTVEYSRESSLLVKLAWIARWQSAQIVSVTFPLQDFGIR